MPPISHVKPENVLRRAEELLALKQPQAALTVLAEQVTPKRSRNSPMSSLEPVMPLFVDLCVDLRKGRIAKDGLHQYKNLSQNTDIGAIEVIVRKFVGLGEKKVAEAQAKAEEVHAGTAATPIDDLDAIETPENLLLATVSGEQSRDRTDRAIVTPWLKFLWETYRIVLDVLKNNSRLEVMYQYTALQAFGFCQRFARKTEFRRLCELLRNHVQSAAKYATQPHSINLNDPDTLQRHLDTRFQQLNVAVELELWQEAFRSVEDVHTLLSLSKRPAKNVMMANYYEKLTRIHLVGGNYLFHAAAYSRYYNLLRNSSALVASGASQKRDNPNVSDADMTKTASLVLLSALAIPVISTSRSRGALYDVDEAGKHKNTRLASLLGMSQPPSRAGIFKALASKDFLSQVSPEIRELYYILEVDFHPMSICKKVSPILVKIAADPELAKYIAPLQQVILTRLFQQLSQVYESVYLKFVYELAQFPEPFQTTPAQIEKFIMNGCKKGDLAIRVDHATGVLTFDSDVFSSSRALHSGPSAGSAETEAGAIQRLQNTPSEIVRGQFTRLAKALHVSCVYVDPSYNEAFIAKHKSILAAAQQNAEKERQETLARRDIIDKKKQAATSALQEKQRTEETRRRLRAQQLLEAEKQRTAEEQRKRELKRIEDERARIRETELKKQLEELADNVQGIDVKDISLDDLDATRIRAMKLEQINKQKSELNEKVGTTAKRIDHLERAYRREELKYGPADYEAQKKHDLELYEQNKQDFLAASRVNHQQDVALKHRLTRLVPEFTSFKKEVTEKRHAEFERRRKAAEREFEAKKKQRIIEVREQRRRERIEREEGAKRQAEEEERAKHEEEQRAVADEERRRQLFQERAERDRLAQQTAPAPSTTSTTTTTMPSRPAAPTEGSWRTGVPTRAPPAAAPAAAAQLPPPSSGGWKPRSRRQESEAGVTARPPPAAQTPTPPPPAATPAAAPSPTPTPTPPPAAAPTPGKYIPPARRRAMEREAAAAAAAAAGGGNPPPAAGGGAPSGNWRG